MKGGIYIESIYIDNSVIEGNEYKYKVYLRYKDGTVEEIEQVYKIEARNSMFSNEIFTLKEILKIHNLASERILSVERRDELISCLEESLLNVNVLEKDSRIVLDYMNIIETLINDLNLELKEESSDQEVNKQIVEENQKKRYKQSIMIQELLRYIYLFELRG